MQNSNSTQVILSVKCGMHPQSFVNITEILGDRKIPHSAMGIDVIRLYRRIAAGTREIIDRQKNHE